MALVAAAPRPVWQHVFVPAPMSREVRMRCKPSISQNGSCRLSHFAIFVCASASRRLQGACRAQVGVLDRTENRVILSRVELQQMIVNKLEIRCIIADDVVKQAEVAKARSDSIQSTYEAHIRSKAMVDAASTHAVTLQEALQLAKSKLLAPAELDRLDFETQLEIQEWLETSDCLETVRQKALKEAETQLASLAELQRQRGIAAKERSKIYAEIAASRPKPKQPCKKYVWMGLCECC